MGRGRAKAKQTKVARQLKYSSGGTDLDRLQEELAAERGSSYTTSTPAVSSDEDDDEDETAPDDEDKYAPDED
jgi:hypothetical protein